MSRFDVFFFVFAWASGVILALSAVIEFGRRNLSRSGKEDRR